jgi:hypothetical protein
MKYPIKQRVKLELFARGIFKPLETAVLLGLEPARIRTLLETAKAYAIQVKQTKNGFVMEHAPFTVYATGMTTWKKTEVECSQRNAERIMILIQRLESTRYRIEF